MVGFSRVRQAGACFSGLVLCLILAVPPAFAQTAPATEDEDEGFVVRDSDVGYIDNPVPGDRISLRYDQGWDLNRANRAEFFYARPQPAGKGLPQPEPRIDHQDLTFVVERLLTVKWSGFAEVGARFLNPQVNDNTAGLGDLRLGLKYAAIEGPDYLLTGQLRVEVPTADVDRGLGTGHASLEPGLLGLARLTCHWTATGEVRYWIPFGDELFAGEVIRYGLGLQYARDEGLLYDVHPVVECVGWTVLDGAQGFPVTPTSVVVEDAAGDTIVNLKLGTRTQLTPCADLYTGYGRCLTGDRWYQDTVRAELRLLY